MKPSATSRQFLALPGSWLARTAIAVVATAAILVLSMPRTGSAEPATAPADGISVGGTCKFSGKDSTWSAKLTLKANNTYDVDYTASWGGKPLSYKGTITSDWKTDVSGEGTNSNGTFKFSGKFGDDGTAKCAYSEVGGRGRSGSLTIKAPAAK